MSPTGRDTQGSAEQLIRALPLFSRIDADQVAALAARASVRRVPRNGVLFHRGAAATGFFIVVEGVIKLSAVAPDGGEKVIEVMHPGDSFGEAVMFLDEPYPVTATALEPTRLVVVPVDAVNRLIDGDAMFARRMLAGMAVRLHTMVRDVQSYALQSSRERVVSHLLESRRAAGPPGDERPVPSDERRAGAVPGGDQSVVTLSTSKQVLASRLNLTPETLSRVLRELSAEGLISVYGRRITLLDVQALALQGRVSVS